MTMVTRYLNGDFVVMRNEWYCGTTLERVQFYDANTVRWEPKPGVALTSSRRAAEHYALSSPGAQTAQGTPLLATVFVPDWLLWCPYRADITPGMINDHRNVIAMRSTLGPGNHGAAVIIRDPTPDAPDALALIILSEEAAAEIWVTEHEFLL